jgi:glycosyltransferase involved in cell wall biosynthesis
VTLENRLVSAARSAWYGTYEPLRLAWERCRCRRVLDIDCKSPGLAEWFWTGHRNPLVTVYIPTYNRFEILTTRALPSVMGQTYTNLEIIVADHSSPDETGKRVAALGDGRVRALDVPRRRRYPPTAENHWLCGPVDPANAALRAARGAWIARIDDDDEWTRDHVEKLLRSAQRNNLEFISSHYKRQWADGAEIIGPDRDIGGTQTWLYRSYLKFMRYNIDCWRKSHDRVNDMDLAERFRRAGVRIGYLDDVTCTVFPRPGEKFVGSKAYLADTAKTEAAYSFDGTP